MSDLHVPPVVRLGELGGIATRGTLLRSCTRGDLDRAMAAGDIVAVARGLLALAAVNEERRAASRLGGVLTLTSAALQHGWAVKQVPDRPHVLVRPGSRVTPADRRAVHVHWGRSRPEDVQDGVTSPLTTLIQCMRRLPFDEALCVVESAMRAGVPGSTVERLGERAKGPGSPQVRRLAEVASAEVANPFESCLHAIALDVPGLGVRPQVTIREAEIVARPDFVDERLRIVLEADSFEWHGGRAQLSADARRYNLLVVNGWIVLRFSYPHVMTQPDFVRRVLVAAVGLARALHEVRPAGGSAA